MQDSRTIRALIADDEEIARQGLRKLLSPDPSIEIIGECSNGRHAVSTILESRPDLVLLDVQMPGLDGFQVIEAISDQHMPFIVMVTAYDEYALRAFEMHATDYLLKPFDELRLQATVERVKKLIQGGRLADAAGRVLGLLEHHNAVGSEKWTKKLAIKNDGAVYFVPVNEVDWFESAGNYVELHRGEESHLIRSTLDDLAAKLNPEQFLRIHRSRIVNMNKVQSFHIMGTGRFRISLLGGVRIESGRTYRRAIEALLNQ